MQSGADARVPVGFGVGANLFKVTADTCPVEACLLAELPYGGLLGGLTTVD